MAHLTIQPARALHGTLTFPGDKSISHRALLVGAIAEGTTRIRHLLDAADVRTTARALATLGIPIRWEKEAVTVEGKGLRGFQPPVRPLDMGNSGTTTRLLLGILAGRPFEATLVGDDSLSKRPMARVTKPLSEMGASFDPPAAEHLPLRIRGGKLRGIFHPLIIPSAQVKSAILLAGLFAQGKTTLAEPTPTRDHTERLLRFFGARITVHPNAQGEGSSVTVEPGAALKSCDLEILGDISSAAFFLTAAAILPGSLIAAKGVGLNPTRTGFLDLLERMGAQVRRVQTAGEDWEPVGEVTVSYRGPLKGVTVEPDEISSLIDELPILMVAATQARGRTLIKGAGELRVKETDRIHSMGEGLVGMGAKVRDVGSQMVIEGPTPLKGATVSSFGDHRTAMALAIAGLVAQGPTTIQGSEWIDISFPEFPRILESIRR